VSVRAEEGGHADARGDGFLEEVVPVVEEVVYEGWAHLRPLGDSVQRRARIAFGSEEFERGCEDLGSGAGRSRTTAAAP
jgi:hypothetical protein